ncbi:hypothetical protein APR49_04635 [Variovorax paradoxus]|nr:hypothetical protein APR49_04635 [Variovorax paradoxus]KPV35087.1 hypothetical protein APR47_14055 [Variovorax paradoxus]
MLANNDDTLAVSADGAFTFSTALAQGATYAVSVRSQPGGPSQVCTVNGGTGTVADTAVTGVKVLCATQSYAVGGTVGGLAGTGLVLQNNAGDDLPVAANGSFVFPVAVASGAAYAVTVKTQPGGPTQLCSVAQGSGTIDADDVASVQVVCATRTRAVNVTVSGLDGQGLVLQNNSGDDLAVGANGRRQFATSVAEGSTYAVTVKSQPRMYTQFCTVDRGNGTVAAADIDDVSVACATPATRSVYVSSLLGSSIPMLMRYSAADLTAQASTIAPATFVSFAADPKGRLVFGGSDSGRVYAIRQGDGIDTMSSATLGAHGAVAVGMHPSGDYLYVVANGDGLLSTYAVPPATPAAPGVLQQKFLSGASGTSPLPLPLAVDPLGRFVFVGTSGQGIQTLPIRADGTLDDPVRQATTDVVSVVVHPSGAYLYAIGTDGMLRTYSIHASTGALTQTALTVAGLGVDGSTSLAIDGRGRMLSLVDTVNQLQYTRAITDMATGALGTPFPIHGLINPVATAFDPSSDGVNFLVGSLNLFRRTIDPAQASYANTLTTQVGPAIRAMVLLNR